MSNAVKRSQDFGSAPREPPDSFSLERFTLTRQLTRRREGSHRVVAVNLAMNEAWPGVILAGGIYGVIAPICIFLDTVITNMPTPGGFEAVLILTMFFLGPLTGLLLAALWSAFSIVIITLINSTFGGLLTRRMGIICLGGMSGYLATIWSLLEIPRELAPLLFASAMVILAMTLGQVGAVRYANRVAAQNRWRSTSQFAADFQFRIWHLFVATGWIALVCLSDQYLPSHQFLIAVSVYIGLQVGMLVLDRVVFQH